MTGNVSDVNETHVSDYVPTADDSLVMQDLHDLEGYQYCRTSNGDLSGDNTPNRRSIFQIGESQWKSNGSVIQQGTAQASAFPVRGENPWAIQSGYFRSVPGDIQPDAPPKSKIHNH